MACSSATEQRVEFLNQHKERLVGTFVDVPGSAACAVLCHGLMAWRDSANYPVLAAALASEAGMSSLRFDFAGCGESDGAFAIAHNRREAEDIRSAVEWVRQSRGKRVQLLVGHSKGGANVLLYSAKYDDVPQVVNLAGRYDMARGIKERYGQVCGGRYLTRHRGKVGPGADATLPCKRAAADVHYRSHPPS